MTEKPRLSFWQIWNMSFGFLGIQFGWGLQTTNMSSIYSFLGAKEELSLLWIAAPLTGLMIQPVVGYLSDRTWTGLGRRRPYFLIGALLATVALVAMPHSSVLWMAVGLLWILDASINITMEPFRAFVADKLPEEQRPSGFSVQSLFIGLGAVIASAMPWMLTNWFGVESGASGGGKIPTAVVISFHTGAVAVHRRALHHSNDSGRSASGHGGVPRDEGTLERSRRLHQRTRPWTAPDAEDHAVARRGAVLHLDRAVLHVDLLDSRHCQTRLRRRSFRRKRLEQGDRNRRRLDGHLFRHLQPRLFLLLVPAAAHRPSDFRQDHPHRLPHDRRGGIAFRAFHHGSTYAAHIDGRRRHRMGVHPLHALRDAVLGHSLGEDGLLHGRVQFLHRHPAGARRPRDGKIGRQRLRRGFNDGYHHRRILFGHRLARHAAGRLSRWKVGLPTGGGH